MKKIIWALLMILPLALPLTLSDFTIDGWYPVEDWEVKVCSRYGGTAEATNIAGARAAGDAYMLKTTVTIQAQVTKGEKNIYEVAWYIRPMEQQQQYKVELFGPDGSEQIYTGSASIHTGDSNYHAMETDKEFINARLTYETGYLLVPIVEK